MKQDSWILWLSSSRFDHNTQVWFGFTGVQTWKLILLVRSCTLLLQSEHGLGKNGRKYVPSYQDDGCEYLLDVQLTEAQIQLEENVAVKVSSLTNGIISLAEKFQVIDDISFLYEIQARQYHVMKQDALWFLKNSCLINIFISTVIT